jgi:6-phosphogluconate dehydrogenase (decarboxylating)
MFKQLGLIGCGLMGGSFALAMKRAGLVKHVVGYSKSPSTVILAQKMGVVDQAAESALLAVSGADIVLIAVPVAATEATFRAIRHLVNPNALFMDVGSTKGDVVDAARRMLKERGAQLRAGASDRRQGGSRHRARRRESLPGLPGHPDARRGNRRRPRRSGRAPRGWASAPRCAR